MLRIRLKHHKKLLSHFITAILNLPVDAKYQIYTHSTSVNINFIYRIPSPLAMHTEMNIYLLYRVNVTLKFSNLICMKL